MSAADIPEPLRSALAHPEAAARLFVELVTAHGEFSASERAAAEGQLTLLGRAAAELGATGALPSALERASELGSGAAEAAAVLVRASLAGSTSTPDAALVKAALALEPTIDGDAQATFELALLLHALAERAGRAWRPRLSAAWARLEARPELLPGHRRTLAALARPPR